MILAGFYRILNGCLCTENVKCKILVKNKFCWLTRYFTATIIEGDLSDPTELGRYRGSGFLLTAR